MFMRLVHVRYKPESLGRIQKIYDTVIIPRLQQVEGCLFVGAIRNEQHPDEGISMTLWDTWEHADAYGRGEVFKELLGKVSPFFAESEEWRIQLSEAMELEVQPQVEEAVVKSYKTLVKSDSAISPEDTSGMLYVRIISLKIQAGKMAEFKKIYEAEIIPAICAMSGCRFSFLTESTEAENEALCLSIWDNKRSADQFEKSGHFDQLKHKVEHTFNELIHWKMALERQYDAQVVTSEDITQKGYDIVTGKSFRPT